MTIRFACTCGQQLSARQEYAGQRVKCAACGASNVVPALNHPTPQPLAPKKKRSWRPLVLLALVVLLGVAAGGYYWWHNYGGAKDDDLAYIPADGNAFLSLRVADSWDKPAGKAFQKQLESNFPQYRGEFETSTGLTPEQIERFTIVWPTQDADLNYAVILTKAPYDRTKVFTAISPDGNPAKHLGHTYRLDAKKKIAVYAPAPRVLIVSNEKGMHRCLETAGKSPADGPLRAGIDLLRDPQYHIVGATGPDIPQTGIPGASGVTQGLKSATMTGKLHAGADLTATLLYGEDKQAKQAEAALQTTMLLFLFGAPAEIKPLLKQTKAKAEGPNLTLTLALDAQQVTDLQRYATEQMGLPLRLLPGLK